MGRPRSAPTGKEGVIEMKRMLFFLLFPGMASAAQYLCPGSMQYVADGDTISSVIQACGQPASRVDSAVSPPGQASVVWYYSVSSQQSMARLNSQGLSTSPQGLTAANLGAVAGGRLPAVVVSDRGVAGNTPGPNSVNVGVAFSNGNVASIQQRGSNSNQSSFQCAGGQIAVGSSMTQVTQACGLPAFQRNLAAPSSSQTTDTTPTQMTQLTYQPNDYMPAVVFIFQNG